MSSPTGYTAQFMRPKDDGETEFRSLPVVGYTDVALVLDDFGRVVPVAEYAQTSGLYMYRVLPTGSSR